MTQESKSSGFRILEHPADLGIEAQGETLAEAFEWCAKGLVSILVDTSSVSSREMRTISLSAHDVDQLLVKWLDEILYLFDGAGFVVKEPLVGELTPTGLTAVLRGEAFESGRHESRLDVKAITYHQLSIRELQGGFVVTVYLDI